MLKIFPLREISGLGGTSILASRRKIIHNQDMRKRLRMESLPGSSEIIPSRWQVFMSKPVNRTVAVILSGSVLLAIFIFAFGEFFSVRGVRHMLTSRLFLGVAALSAWLLSLLVFRTFLRPAKWIIWGSLCAIAIVAFKLDRVFPMPKTQLDSAIAQSPAIAPLTDSQLYERCKQQFQDVSQAAEITSIYMPPQSHNNITVGYSKDARKRSEQITKDSQLATCRLKFAPQELTLRDLFTTDFSSLAGGIHGIEYGIFTITSGRGTVTPIDYAIVKQLDTATKFLIFYIPHSDKTSTFCKFLASKYQDYMNSDRSVRFTAKAPGNSDELDSRDLVFSKRIYIYHETDLPPKALAKIQTAYRKRGISVILRSLDYLTTVRLQAQVSKSKSAEAL
jgi:hypothetical protein